VHHGSAGGGWSSGSTWRSAPAAPGGLTETAGADEGGAWPPSVTSDGTSGGGADASWASIAASPGLRLPRGRYPAGGLTLRSSTCLARLARVPARGAVVRSLLDELTPPSARPGWPWRSARGSARGAAAPAS